MTKSADPNQLASLEVKKPTGLDLHCLQRQDISGFSMTRVKNVERGVKSSVSNSKFKTGIIQIKGRGR